MVILLTASPPQFQYQKENHDLKKKITNQPITAAVQVNLGYKKGCDCLIGGFLFGTEIGVCQLKESPYTNRLGKS